MATFLLRRLWLMLLTLWLLSLIVFLAGRVLPGDPARAILGPLAARSAVQSLDAQLGVNRPLVARYLSWLGGMLHGDMGISYSYRSAVAPFIGSALFNSLKLAALAFVIVVPLGIAGGVIAALRAGRLTDRVISVTGLTLATVPEFVSGIVVIVVFGVTFMLGQTGEYLTLSDQQLNLRPVLATSWKANSTADVWTFKIRQGVKFSNGQPLTADDVVYTYKLQSNPKSGGNALSALGGVLLPSGVVKVDDYTVAFHLQAANGNFPYLTSSDNYNMIILPSGYDPAKWQGTFIGTGPFILKSYTPKVGASFVANPSYWGPQALPAATEFTFYDTHAAGHGGSLGVPGAS